MTKQAIKRKIAYINSLSIPNIEKEIEDCIEIYGSNSSYIISCKGALKQAKSKEKIIKKLETKLNL
jgi:hypothetical protein